MSIYDTNMKGSRSQAYSEIGLSTHAPYDGGFRCHECVRNQPLTQTWIYHSSGRLKYNIIPREEYFPLPNIIIPSISSPWHIPNSWIRHKRPRNISTSYIIHLRLRNLRPTEKKIWFIQRSVGYTCRYLSIEHIFRFARKLARLSQYDLWIKCCSHLLDRGEGKNTGCCVPCEHRHTSFISSLLMGSRAAPIVHLPFIFTVIYVC